MAITPPPPPEEPPAVAASALFESETDHGENRSAEPMADDLFDFDAPMPPQTDALTGKPTANYGYEFQVGIWRDRMTRGLKAVHHEQKRYADDEKTRHTQILTAIANQGSWTKSFFALLHGCGAGTLEIVKTIAGNEQGQLKYFALTLLGLAAIVNGIAFSGFGFSAESAVKCGRGTVEDHGRCVPVPTSAPDPSTGPAPAE